MNRIRIVGALLIVVALAVWLAMRSFGPETQAPPAPPIPQREAFHASKPLLVSVLTVVPAATEASAGPPWLLRELRFLLARGKMNVAPLAPAITGPAAPFTLRVTIKESQAELALIAPDGVVERTESMQLSIDSQLGTIQSLAQRLPQFLGAPAASAAWTNAVGTTDAAAFDAFILASDALFAPTAVGFTLPPSTSSDSALNLERAEALARRHRQFARARALLSLSYLSVGGEDQASLAKLAEAAAERALAADPQLADAQAALGIVRLKRMEWAAAQEHFEAALALDASSLPALEGLGCLLMDVGLASKALPIAARATALQPGNHGARQCARYAQIATTSQANGTLGESPDTARIRAAMLLLAGDREGAESLLQSTRATSDELIRAIISASGDKAKVPQALQIITSSADEETIDAATELLFGTALRRPDFVFNRMLRLAKQNQAVPLRVLWLPQTDFLRKQRRFKEVVSAASLTTYWQDHGLPDVCATEPKVHGCAVKPKG